jgi:hypothetical protein
MSKSYEAPHYASSPTSCYSHTLRSKFSPQHPVFRHPQSVLFLQCQSSSLSCILLLLLLLLLLVLSRWNIEPQQLSVAEVSVAFKYFIETGLVALCSNPQPGGPGLHISIPWRLGGPVNTPGTEYYFSRLLRHTWATVGLFFSPVTTRELSCMMFLKKLFYGMRSC